MVAQRVRAFAPQAEGRMFESQLQQTLVVKKYRSTCGTLKNPHCSMAMSAEHMSKFAALHQ